MYKPSDLREFLDRLNIRPKKGLSQNFLIDGNIIRKIVETANVKPGDIVLEVGPGPGSLTEALLEAGATVLAVEMDPILARELERLKNQNKTLEIFCADILEFPIVSKVKPYLSKGQKAKVIANLPYHVTTPVLTKLVQHHEIFSSLTLMVQDEVARRFVGKPGTSDYSSITVFLNFYSTPKYAFQVSRNCFFPVPRVQSAVVVLDLKKPPLEKNQERFFEMTRTAFNQRRKMLRTSLRDLYPGITEALQAIGKNPQARPEELSLDDFLALYKELASSLGI